MRKNKKFQDKRESLKKYNSLWQKKFFSENKPQKKTVTSITEINKLLEKNQIAKYYKYRLPYRKIHFDYIQLTSNLKLKFFVQNFIQEYFNIQVEAKIVHILNAYKNKNYFRLVFPVWKKKKIKQFLKKRRKKNWKQQQILLVSQLNFVTPTKERTEKNLIKKKKLKFLKKKKQSFLARKKRQKHRLKNYFGRIKKRKEFMYDFKYFIPTLMAFSRSLNPRQLVDVIAKVLHKAKKQTWMLGTIKYLLKGLKLPRRIGYKIVLAGRINSKKKSRVIYFARNQITLQIFNNKMNFAYAQAKARIGTFGIKVWVYSKKIKKNEKNHSATSKSKI